jgi:hypothetical protein
VTLGFNVVLALFILAPGFGVAMALWAAQRHKTFTPAAPATTSTITFAVVALSALIAHTAGAVVFGLLAEAARWICGAGKICLGASEPNPYLILIHAGERDTNLTSWEVIWTLLSLSLLTVAMMRATELAVESGYFSPLLYGWMAPVLEDAAPANRYVIAYVLTDISKGGDHLVGYQGFLDDMNLGLDKDIVSVTLTDAEPFYVKLGDEKLERVYAQKDKPYARLHFTKDEIKNLVLEVQEPEADEVMSAESDAMTSRIS